MNIPKEIQTVFFEDPRWVHVEELIMSYITPLMDMHTIDLKQPAEAVKAEVIGRMIAYDKLTEFIEQTKMVGTEKRIIPNVFK